MAGLRDVGIDVIVSMIQSDEAAELGLEDQGAAAERAGLVFVSFAIPDRVVPSVRRLFSRFVNDLEGRLVKGSFIGVHWRACIGRASVTAASLLIRFGVSPEVAWLQVASARGCSVPDTVEQREWVDRYVKAGR